MYIISSCLNDFMGLVNLFIGSFETSVLAWKKLEAIHICLSCRYIFELVAFAFGGDRLNI